MSRDPLADDLPDATHTLSAAPASDARAERGAAAAPVAASAESSDSDEETAPVQRALTQPVLPHSALHEQRQQQQQQERRRGYGVVGWEELPSLEEARKARGLRFTAAQLEQVAKKYDTAVRPASAELNQRVCVYNGDSTRLAVDAIVNAANRSLLGGGGIDGAIHSAAGHGLYDECRKLNGCDTGFTKITGGHRLPAKHILHTVGPVGEKPAALRSCYETCMEVGRENKCRSIAFCCVSTGIYGYPNRPAAVIALNTVRDYLEKYPESYDRIIFVTFMPIDTQIYNELIHVVFPPVELA